MRTTTVRARSLALTHAVLHSIWCLLNFEQCSAALQANLLFESRDEKRQVQKRKKTKSSKKRSEERKKINNKNTTTNVYLFRNDVYTYQPVSESVSQSSGWLTRSTECDNWTIYVNDP